jgi:hypothetical protein
LKLSCKWVYRQTHCKIKNLIKALFLQLNQQALEQRKGWLLLRGKEAIFEKIKKEETTDNFAFIAKEPQLTKNGYLSETEKAILKG